MDVDKLKHRRKELAQKRLSHDRLTREGSSIAKKIGEALKREISIADFDTTSINPILLPRVSDYREANGLKLPYVTKEKAISTLVSCNEALSSAPGIVGFDEYSFLGTLKQKELYLPNLAYLAETLHSEVFFYPESHNGYILVNYYKDCLDGKDVGFSIVVSGKILEKALSFAF
ncbi:MAG: hypothetical protein MRY72_08275 [Aquisalinus sp.]|nr:hypothetical protein [Aquisalinus sp.]